MNQLVLRRYGLAVAAALAAAGSVGAQTTLGILDRGRLAEVRSEIAANPSRSAAEVSVLVRYASDDALAALEASGARVLHRERTVALASIPADRVEELLLTPGIKSASLSRRVRRLNDMARAASNVDAVHAGEGLDRAYKGKGVIVGIFDMGFDPNHINFNDSEGNSRVKRMNTYFQRYDGVAPSVSRNETPSAIARFTTDSSDDTHATHVIGTAAGSFSEAGADYSGVAPEAELFMCGGYGTYAEMALAFADMTDYAANSGKPLVVNLSLVDNEGPHDGSDEFSLMLDEVAERTGTHFFLAAGNEGDYGIGLYKEFKADDTVLRTCLKPDDSYGSYYGPPTEGNIEIWSEDDKPFTLYVDLIDKTKPEAPVTSVEIPRDGGMYLANGTTPSGVSSSMINRGDASFNAVYSQSYIGAETALSPQNGRFYSVVSFDLTAKNQSMARTYTMALRVEGEAGQKVYAYVNTSYYNYQAYFPVSFESYNLPGFVSSDGNGSISGMACGKNTIAVGAYNTRNIASDAYYEKDQPIGEPTYFSSWGNLPGGRVKPDISAPGFLIVSSMSGPYVAANNRYLSSNGTPKYYQYTDPATVKTHYWTYMAGTSMATPFMTGVAALWLEANPYLTTEDIRDIAARTAIMSESGNPKWGASGKVDALAGLKMAMGYSDVANVEADGGKETIVITPRGGASYELFAPGDEEVSASVYDLSGSLLLTAGGTGTVDLDLSGVPSGVYLLKASTSRSARSVKVAL